MIDPVNLYHQYRQDHVARYSGNGEIYHHKVRAGDAWTYAKRNADVMNRWNEAEAKGLVRLRAEPDTISSIDDLTGDTYNPDVIDYINPVTLERQRQKYIELIDREGVWEIIGEYHNGEEWVEAVASLGYVGDGWEEECIDLKSETLDKLETVRHCSHCGRPIRSQE